MTNKPMLSVERELLEIYTGRKDGDWVEAGHELRALLDNPEYSTCKGLGVVDDGEMTHSAGGIPYECGPIKCVKDCPDCSKPAAHHQGILNDLSHKGPAAEITTSLVHYGKPATAIPAAQHQGDPVVGHCTHPPGCKFCSWCGFKAEQPAPVAVVMPKRPRADEEEYERMSDYDKGLLHGGIELWDKIDKLNGTK